MEARNVCFIVLKWKLPKRTFRRYARSYASQKTKRKDASFDKFEVSPSQMHPVTVRAHAYTRLADFWEKKHVEKKSQTDANNNPCNTAIPLRDQRIKKKKAI